MQEQGTLIELLWIGHILISMTLYVVGVRLESIVLCWRQWFHMFQVGLYYLCCVRSDANFVNLEKTESSPGGLGRPHREGHLRRRGARGRPPRG